MSKIRILFYVLAVLSFFVSTLWLYSQPDYEPFLSLLSSFAAIVGLVTSDDLKDYDSFIHWASRQPEFAALLNRFSGYFDKPFRVVELRNWLIQALREYHWIIWLISAVVGGMFIYKVGQIPFNAWMGWRSKQVFMEKFWLTHFSNCKEDLWTAQLDFEDLKGFLTLKAKPEEFEIRQLELTKYDSRNEIIWAAHVYVAPSASRIYRKSAKKDEQANSKEEWSGYVNGFEVAQVFNLYGVNSEIVMLVSYSKKYGWSVMVPSGWYPENVQGVIEKMIVEGLKAPRCENVP